MKPTLFLFYLFISSFAFSQDSISSGETPPIFDGVVEEEEWKGAQSFLLPYEINPGDNSPAPHETKAFIRYTSSHLYVGFIAYADMNNLRSSIRKRDEGFSDDNVQIGIDTYGDGRYMILVGANPEGNQIDGKLLPNDEDDYDLNFESKASKHSDSYHVELKIPFNVLAFRNAPEMRWKVVFVRTTYTDDTRSQSINFKLDRNQPCFICQTPSEIILKNIVSKKRVNLLPYVFGGLSGNRDSGSFSYNKPQGNVGLSGLFDLSSVTTLEFALNPDFSQVEADVSQINANTTFALFFPERRPYFNEGNEIINTELNTVYTRTINNPIGSTKLIHQGEHDRLYWLTAYDESSPYLIAGENGSYTGKGGKAFSNIISYQRTLDQGAYLGVLSTNRYYQDGGNGNTFGINGLVRFKEIYAVNFELNGSFITEPEQDWIDSNDRIKGKTVALDGEKKAGNAVLLSIDRTTRNWNTNFNYQHYSPLYETPLGFVTQNSIRNMEFTQSYTYFPKNKEGLIQQLNISAGSEFTFNYNGLRKYFDFFGDTFIQWKGNFRTSINLGHIINEEFEGFIGKNLTEFSLFNGYSPNERINLRAFVRFSESIRYDAENPGVGHSLFVGTFNNFQLTPKLSISPSIRYSQFKIKGADSLEFKGYIGRLNTNYQFNQDVSFRLIGEFNDFDDNFFVQPLLQWNPNPFTIFYVGGTYGYSRIEEQRNFLLNDAQLYFKFQYLFDL